MSILIKGMKMPKSCGECLDIGWQYVFECNLDDVEEGKKLITCPLVPVPPHGRLIDADALEKSLVTQLEQCTRLLGLLECVDNLRVIEGQREVLEGILEEINNALTVIPADEEERRNVE